MSVPATEAHRVVNIRDVACRLRRYPQAGDTDMDDDYVPELEAPMDAALAVPSVASSAQSQADLSSLIIRPTALSAVSQMAAVSAEDLKAFADSRNTSHFKAVIPIGWGLNHPAPAS
jgi:hypothetical protein